jgi:hypothetical protein
MRVNGILRLVSVLALLSPARLNAQRGNVPQVPAPSSGATARSAALKDFTGYWVSVVTEDWRWRMVVPDKGDYVTIPLNADGRKVANTWDPAKDQASGNQCRGYGAAAIMNVPGRLHIYWQDDNTLRIDTDAGTQTRLLHFGGSATESKVPDWQGYSAVHWGDDEPIIQRIAGGGPIGQGGPEYEADVAGGFDGTQGQRAETYKPPLRSYLHVATTHMRPGYLHKNGVPYGTNATLDEYLNGYSIGGATWLFVTSVVTDPQYLMEQYITHSHFKKLPDNSGWDPTPCRADEPR